MTGQHFTKNSKKRSEQMAARSTIAVVFAMLKDASMKQSNDWADRDPRSIVDSWCSFLDDVDDEPLLIATKVYIRQDSKWWPTPGQLIAIIPPSGAPLLGCDAAWTRASENLKRLRPPWHPERPWRLAERNDEHDAAVVALRAAGWVNLCNSNEQRLNYAKRDFGIAFTAEMARTTAARRWLEAKGGARQLTGDAPRQLPDAGVRS